MCSNIKAYMHLCTNYMPYVVGKQLWDNESRDEPMSEIADMSDNSSNSEYDGNASDLRSTHARDVEGV